MVEKKLKGFGAPQLRAILIASLVLLFALGGGLFWFMREQLVDLASKVRDVNIEAATTDTNAIRLKGLQKTLDDEKVAVTRAKNIVADSEAYRYQEKLINDLTRYAKKAGVTIVSINFNPTIDSGADTIPGLKKISMTVSLGDGVTYKSIMQFIRYIEFNLTKMQIKGISLSNTSPGTGSLQLSVPSLEIEVYAR